MLLLLPGHLNHQNLEHFFLLLLWNIMWRSSGYPKPITVFNNKKVNLDEDIITEQEMHPFPNKIDFYHIIHKLDKLVQSQWWSFKEMNVTGPSAFVHVACKFFKVEHDTRKAGKGVECEKCKLPTARRWWTFQDDETTNLPHCHFAKELHSSSNFSHMYGDS